MGPKWMVSGLAAGILLAGQSVAAPSVTGGLPDWSGVWIPDVARQRQELDANPPPWTPTAARTIAAQTVAIAAGHPQDLFVNCLPEGMPSWMMISHQAMEILFTPGRVTMLGEADGNAMRRIYTDGRSHPADPDPTFHGHSVGRWEGHTLVVDTVAILPQVYFALSEGIGIPNNGDMHVVEHIHLTAPDTLADDLEITAPHILTASWRTTRTFDRQRGPASDIQEGVCREGDFIQTQDARGNAIFAPAQQQSGNRVGIDPR